MSCEKFLALSRHALFTIWQNKCTAEEKSSKGFLATMEVRSASFIDNHVYNLCQWCGHIELNERERELEKRKLEERELMKKEQKDSPKVEVKRKFARMSTSGKPTKHKKC